MRTAAMQTFVELIQDSGEESTYALYLSSSTRPLLYRLRGNTWLLSARGDRWIPTSYVPDDVRRLQARAAARCRRLIRRLPSIPGLASLARPRPAAPPRTGRAGW